MTNAKCSKCGSSSPVQTKHACKECRYIWEEEQAKKDAKKKDEIQSK